MYDRDDIAFSKVIDLLQKVTNYIGIPEYVPIVRDSAAYSGWFLDSSKFSPVLNDVKYMVYKSKAAPENLRQQYALYSDLVKLAYAERNHMANVIRAILKQKNKNIDVTHLPIPDHFVVALKYFLYKEIVSTLEQLRVIAFQNIPINEKERFYVDIWQSFIEKKNRIIYDAVKDAKHMEDTVSRFKEEQLVFSKAVHSILNPAVNMSVHYAIPKFHSLADILTLKNTNNFTQSEILIRNRFMPLKNVILSKYKKFTLPYQASEAVKRFQEKFNHESNPLKREALVYLMYLAIIKAEEQFIRNNLYDYDGSHAMRSEILKSEKEVMPLLDYAMYASDNTLLHIQMSRARTIMKKIFDTHLVYVFTNIAAIDNGLNSVSGIEMHR